MNFYNLPAKLSALTIYHKTGVFTMSKSVNSFLGGSAGRVIMKLLVISLIVGFVLKILGLSPANVWGTIYNFFLGLWNMGFAAFGSLFDILLVGALVVIPVFLIGRLLKMWR